MRGWTEEGILRAWRALSDQEEGKVWRFVRLTELGPAEIEIARHFPGSREAILIALPQLDGVHLGVLPKGRGFEMSIVQNEDAFPDRFVVSLCREEDGSSDIFAVVAVDVIRLIDEARFESASQLLGRFLDRVRDWQLFMERRHQLLSTDRQVGLFGELHLLSSLANSELGANALKTWKGPLRAACDFQIERIGIEVKSATRKRTFIAEISSIEQLDNECAPMFLCAMRFEEHEDGTSLPKLVNDLRSRLRGQGNVRAFEALLMTAGYFDEHAAHYGRLLTLSDARVFEVDAEFPYLARKMMPSAVRGVSYSLDIDAISTRSFNLAQLFSHLKLTFHES